MYDPSLPLDISVWHMDLTETEELLGVVRVLMNAVPPDSESSYRQTFKLQSPSGSPDSTVSGSLVLSFEYVASRSPAPSVSSEVRREKGDLASSPLQELWDGVPGILQVFLNTGAYKTLSITNATTVRELILIMLDKYFHVAEAEHAKRYRLTEIWNDNERIMDDHEHPLLVRQKWTDLSCEVKFFLKTVDSLGFSQVSKPTVLDRRTMKLYKKRSMESSPTRGREWSSEDESDETASMSSDPAVVPQLIVDTVVKSPSALKADMVPHMVAAETMRLMADSSQASLEEIKRRCLILEAELEVKNEAYLSASMELKNAQAQLTDQDLLVKQLKEKVNALEDSLDDKVDELSTASARADANDASQSLLSLVRNELDNMQTLFPDNDKFSTLLEHMKAFEAETSTNSLTHMLWDLKQQNIRKDAEIQQLRKTVESSGTRSSSPGSVRRTPERSRINSVELQRSSTAVELDNKALRARVVECEHELNLLRASKSGLSSGNDVLSKLQSDNAVYVRRFAECERLIVELRSSLEDKDALLEAKEDELDTIETRAADLLSENLRLKLRVEQHENLINADIANLEKEFEKLEQIGMELMDDIEEGGRRRSSVVKRKASTASASNEDGAIKPLKSILLPSGDRIRRTKHVRFSSQVLFLDATLDGDLEMVKKCLADGVDINSSNEEGLTALHNSSCNGHLKIVQHLIENGAYINVSDADGWTPLHGAACFGSVVVVRYLVEHGANIDAQNEEGDYPIDLTDDDETRTYLVEVKRRKESSSKAVALYDYTRINDDELSFQAGDRVEVVSRLDPDWWAVRSSKNEVGLVPSNYFTYPVSSLPYMTHAVSN